MNIRYLYLCRIVKDKAKVIETVISSLLIIMMINGLKFVLDRITLTNEFETCMYVVRI